MEIEEAIIEIKDASDSEVRYGDTKHHHDEVIKRVEAFDMAIKALAQQICDNDCEHCDWVTCPKMEEETETITVSKGCLKTRKGRFVVYDVEYLKNHIDIEAKIYGQHAPERDDCISRQKAISAIQDEYYDHAVGIDIVDIIAHMPPVIPKVKQQIDVKAIYDIAFTDGVKAYKNAIELEKEEKEVTEDRPTGRWIDIQYFKNDDTYYRPKCPFCSIEPKEYSNFCPNCGARMAESEEGDK